MRPVFLLVIVSSIVFGAAQPVQSQTVTCSMKVLGKDELSKILSGISKPFTDTKNQRNGVLDSLLSQVLQIFKNASEVAARLNVTFSTIEELGKNQLPMGTLGLSLHGVHNLLKTCIPQKQIAQRQTGQETQDQGQLVVNMEPLSCDTACQQNAVGIANYDKHVAVKDVAAVFSQILSGAMTQHHERFKKLLATVTQSKQGVKKHFAIVESLVGLAVPFQHCLQSLQGMLHHP
ncbi:hypothetical protein PoB_002528000 [Plakobranchus ocellatus]|uniref:Uncharacterized protein n=1 Tax=Plakobranchus ocellatus TaxID=259542 RepID=A0AAV3ZUE8_9GAST|nr:hypothetical protein PoB_002528000 [Plakobranchus ocellatus]